MWLCPTTSSTFELLCRRAQLIIRAHAYDAQHPQYAGSEFNVDGLDTDALDAMPQKKVVMLPARGKKGGAKEA